MYVTIDTRIFYVFPVRRCKSIDLTKHDMMIQFSAKLIETYEHFHMNIMCLNHIKFIVFACMERNFILCDIFLCFDHYCVHVIMQLNLLMTQITYILSICATNRTMLW